MAEEAVRLRKQYDWPVLVVAGSGHVEYGWGIAKRIRWFDPGARVLSIMPWRGGEFDDEAGDLFFYSPDSYQSKMGALLTGLPEGGILVESVDRASRAAKAGLRPGDVLVEASGVRLDSLMHLHLAGKKVHDADEPLVFTVRRGETLLTADVGKLGTAKPGCGEKARQGGGPVMRQLISACLLLLLLPGTGLCGDLSGLFPEGVGDLVRVRLLVGDAAQAEVDKLHGKPLPAEASAVARYARPGERPAEVWVSRVADESEARRQTGVMVHKMYENPKSPVQGPGPPGSRRAGRVPLPGHGHGPLHLVRRRPGLVGERRPRRPVPVPGRLLPLTAAPD